MLDVLNLEKSIQFGNVKEELKRYDEGSIWSILYERLKNHTKVSIFDDSVSAARDVQNRLKNRFRNVSPYDSTRIRLCDTFDGDYINASAVCVPEVPSRSYILTQSPMEHTIEHFWLMVWERRCPAIIMLNRLVEKGTIQCHSYLPFTGGSTFLKFENAGLEVRLENEITTELYTQRSINLYHPSSTTSHRVIHMHYLNWPDFGVPTSPNDVLRFLWVVRNLGVLDDPKYPSVIHCNAGIGRSGAFVLIDLAIKLIEEENTTDGISLTNLFIELRKCRMGIVQTADQLRFCYQAVAKAADVLLAISPDERKFAKFETNFNEESDVANYVNNISPVSNSGSSSSSDSSTTSWLDDGIAFSNDEDGEDDVAEYYNVKYFCPISEKTESQVMTNLYDGTTGEAHFQGFDPVIRNSWLSGRTTNENPLDTTLPIPSMQRYCDTINKLYDTHRSEVSPTEPTIESDGISLDVKSGDKNETNNIGSHAYVIDRSNNAVPSVSVLDNPPVEPSSSRTISDATETVSVSSSTSIEVDNPRSLSSAFSASGDNAAQQFANDQLSSHNLMLGTTAAGAGSDLQRAEYMNAILDLGRRREARRIRQERMRERIQMMRARMLETDAQRKRWLPARFIHYLHRFYAESGYVQTMTGAVLSSLFLLGLFGVGVSICLSWYLNRGSSPSSSSLL